MTAEAIRLFQERAQDCKVDFKTVDDAIAFALFEVAAQLAELNAAFIRVLPPGVGL